MQQNNVEMQDNLSRMTTYLAYWEQKYATKEMLINVYI